MESRTRTASPEAVGILWLDKESLITTKMNGTTKARLWAQTYIVDSDFFLPIGTGTGTHSIGKNGIKIKRIGIYYQCTRIVKLISKEEKVRTRQDAFISL